jgi:hypothetical protein
MTRSSTVSSALFGFLLGIAAASGPMAQTPVPEKPQVPAIRTGITMVPVDVRVLDRDGKPVTDLKQGDFIVLEDSVRQKIEHFSATDLTPETPAPGARPQFRKPNDPEIAPRNQRTFLLVLGRGRLQSPTKGMDADRHTASLELAFFCGDPRQHVGGELCQKTDLKLRDETYQRSLKDGYVHSATVTISAPPKYVKAVVYDPNGDVVGSTIVEIRK